MMALGAGAALLSPWVASLVLVRCCCWTGGVGPSAIVLADGVLFLLFWLSACWLLLLLASIPSRVSLFSVLLMLHPSMSITLSCWSMPYEYTKALVIQPPFFLVLVHSLYWMSMASFHLHGPLL